MHFHFMQLIQSLHTLKISGEVLFFLFDNMLTYLTKLAPFIWKTPHSASLQFYNTDLQLVQQTRKEHKCDQLSQLVCDSVVSKPLYRPTLQIQN